MSSDAIGFPSADEFAPFYRTYVTLVDPGEDLCAALEQQATSFSQLVASLPPERWTQAYASGKWTVAGVIQHICDAEWVFMGRAMWIARQGPGPLPGMDQDDFVAGYQGGSLDATALAAQFVQLRGAAVAMLRALPPEHWLRRGLASGAEVSVRAQACIALGHVRHHLGVLAERYGITAAGTAPRG